MDIFFVIADPTRRKMIDMLAAGPLQAGVFVATFPNVSQPAVSQHLKVLRDSGLVSVAAQQQRRIYSLTPQALDPVIAWISAHRPGTEAAPPTPKPRAKPAQRPTSKPTEQPAMLDLFG